MPNRAINLENITSVGVRGAECAVVATQKAQTDQFVVGSTATQMFTISNEIGCVMTGRIGDSRAQVATARYEARLFQTKFNFEMPVNALCDRLADIIQAYTQIGAIRPLACSMILISCNDEVGPCVYKLDPAANYSGYRACATGARMTVAQRYLECNYMNNMCEMKAINLAIRTLKAATPNKLNADGIEIGLLSKTRPTFRTLVPDEVKFHCKYN
ncbi:proteasome subunit alpha type-6 [Drosophila grimshawi]|uniref:GH24506 n=1 Tax=Drosophila grimshawi TaxID=7222 RepID=B4JLR9_DROGR|nr:proteasome subunit alpha type-6 [Drosophila grimshawi]EDV91680.1 GH24506 [Drosophila grimshawi]